MKKSNLTKYAVLGVLITGQMSYAQEEKYSAGSVTRSDVTVSRAEILRSEIARRQQLLAQSEKQAEVLNGLQKQYASQLAQGKVVEASLDAAVNNCLESCTKAELRKLTEDINKYSAITAGTLAGLNFARIVFLGLLGCRPGGSDWEEDQINRGLRSFYRPWKTLSGSLMLSSGVVAIGSSMFNNYIDAKDLIPRQKIQRYQAEFKSHLSQLENINTQIKNSNAEIAKINAALKQTIKIQQFQQTQVEAKVGYE